MSFLDNISAPYSQAFRLELRLTSLALLVLRFSDLDWNYTAAFLGLQLVEGRFGVSPYSYLCGPIPCVYMCVYIYIYIYVCVYIHICVCIYIYICNYDTLFLENPD